MLALLASWTFGSCNQTSTGCKSCNDAADNAASCDCGSGPGSTPTGSGSGPGNPQCPEGKASCNGPPDDDDRCETDLRDLDNCGACGVVCAEFPGAEARCTDSCESVCLSGLADCDPDVDGCETSLSDAASCGRCDRLCDTTCSDELCAPTDVLTAADLATALGLSEEPTFAQFGFDPLGDLHLVTDAGLMRVAAAGGATLYAPGFKPSYGSRIIVDEARAYVAFGGDGTFSVSLADGAVTEISPEFSYQLGLIGDHLYLDHETGIGRAPRAGGVIEPVYAPPGGYELRSFVALDDVLVVGLESLSEEGAIAVFDPTTLAQTALFEDLAADPENVYVGGAKDSAFAVFKSGSGTEIHRIAGAASRTPSIEPFGELQERFGLEAADDRAVYLGSLFPGVVLSLEEPATSGVEIILEEDGFLQVVATPTHAYYLTNDGRTIRRVVR